MANDKIREFEVGDSYDPQLMKETPEVIKNTLEGIAYGVVNESYTKTLSEEEVTERRKQLANVSIEINDIEEEKKEVIAHFKERLAQPLSDKKDLLSAIKHKSEYRKGNLYHMDDQEKGFMYIFDEEGICVDSRLLKPTERQGRIRTINQEVSNG